MRYTITMSITRDKYGYDEVKSEATFEADGLQPTTLFTIADAMVRDVTEKADVKFAKPVAKPTPTPPQPSEAPLLSSFFPEPTPASHLSA